MSQQHQKIPVYTSIAEIARHGGVCSETAARRLLDAGIKPLAIYIAGAGRQIPLFCKSQLAELRRIVAGEPICEFVPSPGCDAHEPFAIMPGVPCKPDQIAVVELSK